MSQIGGKYDAGPVLLIYHPDGTCQPYPLELKESLTIGRHSTVDLQLSQDQGISRIQVQLIKVGPYFYIINRSTTVETFLNSQPLLSHHQHSEPLHHLDEVQFGQYRLVFTDLNDTRITKALAKNKQTENISPAKAPASIDEDKESKTSSKSTYKALHKGFELKEDGTIHYRGQQLHVSRRLYHLLKCLLDTYPEGCDAKDMDRYLSEHEIYSSLPRLVNDLRNQIKPIWNKDETGPIKIKNLSGFGYQLVID